MYNTYVKIHALRKVRYNTKRTFVRVTLHFSALVILFFKHEKMTNLFIKKHYQYSYLSIFYKEDPDRTFDKMTSLPSYGLNRKQKAIVSCVAFFLLLNLIQDEELMGHSGSTRSLSIKEKNKSLLLNKERLLDICKETNDMLSAAYEKGSKEAPDEWLDSYPFFELSCNQLVLSLQEDDDDRAARLNIDESTTSVEVTERAMEKDIFLYDNLSNRRMAEKLQKLQSGEKLRILAIGGSMTTGEVDYKFMPIEDKRHLAWPQKIQQVMDEKWGEENVEMINIAKGGHNLDSWLSEWDYIAEHAYTPVDIILMESAVNDQGEYHTQESDAKHIAEKSDVLLNLLMRLPGEPAVMSVELYRLGGAHIGDPQGHCGEHVKFVDDPILNIEHCYYCEQWWMPQTWRDAARKKNSVARVSYRDATWPVQAHPPSNLCQYWDGLSHPEAVTHSLVASTVVFHFSTVLEKQQELLALSHDENAVISLPTVEMPDNICEEPITSMRTAQGNSVDPMNLPNDGSSCWIFRSDSKDKYGWICEYGMDGTTFGLNEETTASERALSQGRPIDDYLHLQQEIQLGTGGKLILSRLMSWDPKMAEAEVWLSTVAGENVFEEDPVWTIDSNHEASTSIPVPWFTNLRKHIFKATTGLSWEEIEEGKGVSVVLNIKLKTNTAQSSKEDSEHGIDKFKLLGITTC